VASTIAYVLLCLALRGALPAQAANALSLVPVMTFGEASADR
jgi:hypothetical protein